MDFHQKVPPFRGKGSFREPQSDFNASGFSVYSLFGSGRIARRPCPSWRVEATARRERIGRFRDLGFKSSTSADEFQDVSNIHETLGPLMWKLAVLLAGFSDSWNPETQPGRESLKKGDPTPVFCLLLVSTELQSLAGMKDPCAAC